MKSPGRADTFRRPACASCGRQVVERRDDLLGDDEQMNGRGGLDVVDGDVAVVLEDDPGGDGSIDDFGEDGLFHDGEVRPPAGAFRQAALPGRSPLGRSLLTARPRHPQRGSARAGRCGSRQNSRRCRGVDGGEIADQGGVKAKALGVGVGEDGNAAVGKPAPAEGALRRRPPLPGHCRLAARQ
jgi:hypothetical protein